MECSRPWPPSVVPAPGATDLLDDGDAGDQSAALSLPAVLPCPRVRKGTETSAVVFVTDAVLQSITSPRIVPGLGMQSPDTIYNREGWAKVVKFSTWHPWRDFDIPTLTGRELGEYGSDAPYRISFALTSSFSRSLPPVFLPVQQCVRQTSEIHGLSKRPSHTAWFRDPSDLVGFFEPTPISKQLDELLDRFPHRRVQAPDLSLVDGPLRKFLLPVMYPKRRLLPPYWAINGRWRMDPDGVAR